MKNKARMAVKASTHPGVFASALGVEYDRAILPTEISTLTAYSNFACDDEPCRALSDVCGLPRCAAAGLLDAASGAHERALPAQDDVDCLGSRFMRI
jgi:hypothetical protein